MDCEKIYRLAQIIAESGLQGEEEARKELAGCLPRGMSFTDLIAYHRYIQERTQEHRKEELLRVRDEVERALEWGMPGQAHLTGVAEEVVAEAFDKLGIKES